MFVKRFTNINDWLSLEEVIKTRENSSFKYVWWKTIYQVDIGYNSDEKQYTLYIDQTLIERSSNKTWILEKLHDRMLLDGFKDQYITSNNEINSFNTWWNSKVHNSSKTISNNDKNVDLLNKDDTIWYSFETSTNDTISNWTNIDNDNIVHKESFKTLNTIVLLVSWTLIWTLLVFWRVSTTLVFWVIHIPILLIVIWTIFICKKISHKRNILFIKDVIKKTNNNNN